MDPSSVNYQDKGAMILMQYSTANIQNFGHATPGGEKFTERGTRTLLSNSKMKDVVI